MILAPIKFQQCDENEHMSDLVFILMDCAEKNIDLGYKIDLQHLEEIIGAGLTYATLDMLINNLNQDLYVQFDTARRETPASQKLRSH